VSLTVLFVCLFFFGGNNLTHGSSFKSVIGRVVTEEFYVTAAASVEFYIRTALIGEDDCSFSQTV